MFSSSEKKQRALLIVTFLFVPLLLLLAFSYVPCIKLIQQSFTDWDGFRPKYNYVGLANYVEMFSNNVMLKTLLNNMAYVIIALIQIVAALYFAIILDSNIKGKNFFRSMVFMPYILNGVAVAYMFNYLYNYQDGPINIVLTAIGLGQYSVHWLSQSWFSNMALAFMGFWQFTGLNMVVFIGALQSIPRELYESASMDGANFFQNVKYITAPSISLVIKLNMFLAINGALQAFNQAFLITHGGPGDATQTFASYSYFLAFNFHNFGKASAMGVFLLAIIAIIMLFQRVTVSGGGEEI
jgi:raffinose/stachyose/melibiose transport system permease protein